MGQVAVTINGRTYRLRCGDGEEERLITLAGHLKLRVEELAHEFGQVGDDRLMLMAALLMADELWDAKSELERALTEATEALKQAAELAKAYDAATSTAGSPSQAVAAGADKPAARPGGRAAIVAATGAAGAVPSKAGTAA